MNFYSKLIALLFISGCAAVNISEISNNINSLFMTKNKSISQRVYSNHVTSNLIVINDQEETVYKLNDYEGRFSIWNSNEIYLRKYKGKLMNSIGLANDFIIYFDEKDLNRLYKNNISIDALISFTNPKTSYLDINYIYSYLDQENINLNNFDLKETFTIVEEKFNVEKIKWKGRNLYVINTKGDVIYSEQFLTPFKKKIIYFYK